MSIHEVTKCEVNGCRGEVEFNRHCGAKVCSECDNHQGLARCFCGWSLSGRDGRVELEEYGETIDPEEEW
jgi:hypothetical protein